MPEAFIVDAVRTPIGRFRGALKGVRPDDLAAHVLRAVLERNGVEGARVDEVFLGCANQAGEDNRNVARMALLLAGLPDSVPGVTVNRLCASGLEAVIQGCRMIRVGEADIVLAGGVESMTRAPWSMAKPEEGFPTGRREVWDTTLGWRYPNPRLAERFPLDEMGETAERVAKQWNVSRAEQDAHALASHQKAVAAHEAGRFAREIVPVDVPLPKGGVERVAFDEGPRADTSLERLAKLKPAFAKDGTVTPGNASTLNDGASAVLLMSEAALRATGATPLARFVSCASAGVDPRVMGIGPVPATREALERAKWSVDSVDLAELNEAFASQVLACLKELALPADRVNVNGGALALGHPLGCSGARILTTLVHELKRRDARRGLAALCVGVGQGLAMTVER
ncbi:thiolase family protein [Myxococcus sp. K15C18031901]|uniref:thiolase family protein n=1 Tax=Myxococcus dinghuensis TaxID=2906761 RepID=UPI0020A7F83C|nr:thiolase family protein [Myxococcus dinghuensis]MCP3102489.1 thiolase family protein [Myxococcus dinghuensis]